MIAAATIMGFHVPQEEERNTLRGSKNMEDKNRFIDPSITIMGLHNNLVAVDYGDGMHFTGTFVFDGAAYEYDGSRSSAG